MARKTRTKPAQTCKQATALLTDYLAGTLATAVASELERHLSVCPDCVAFLRTYKKTIQVTQSLLLSGLLPELDQSRQQALHKSIGNHRDAG